MNVEDRGPNTDVYGNEIFNKILNLRKICLYHFLWKEIFEKILAQDLGSGQMLLFEPNVGQTFDLLAARKNLAWSGEICFPCRHHSSTPTKLRPEY